LATGQVEPRPASARLPVLVFRLGQERYAVELKEVSEVLPFAHCTPVPGAPPSFFGVIGLRGELRSVVDLGHLLTRSASANSDSGFVLMLRRPGHEIGLKVDSIEELREISLEELSPSPQGNHVKGIASGSLMLVEIGALMTDILSKEGVLI
jgi:purine-binding chemotaxis protein CheW